MALPGETSPHSLESQAPSSTLTPFPRKTSATEFLLQGLYLHPAKIQEVLRKTYHRAFLRKRSVSLPGKKSWINLEGRPGLANNQDLIF